MFADDPDQMKAPPLFDRRLVGRLMLYVRSYAIYLVLSIAVLFVMALTLNYLPVLIMRGIDDFLAGTSIEVDAHKRLAGIVHIGGTYLVIAAIGLSLAIWSELSHGLGWAAHCARPSDRHFQQDDAAPSNVF